MDGADEGIQKRAKRGETARVVLKALEYGGPMTANEVAAATGLSTSAASAGLQRLLDEGKARKAGKAPNPAAEAPGRTGSKQLTLYAVCEVEPKVVNYTSLVEQAMLKRSELDLAMANMCRVEVAVEPSVAEA
jgi:DNA-binding Lrp family transcriptional regulator